MNRRSRGAALPETALVLTLLLALLVGAFRLALVGYEQVTADGAAFYDAHQAALKQTSPSTSGAIDAEAATRAAFPHAAPAAINHSPEPAPNPLVPTEYGFDQTDNRHGGVSLIEPMRMVSTVVRSNLAPLMLFGGGSVLSVTGVGVEPSFLEAGIHGDVMGDPFGSTGSFTNASDYFTHGENTPPYFGGFHYLKFCDVANPPVGATPDPPAWNACPTGVSFLALGLAEYLDADNWGRSPNGVAPMPQAVFWETLYHQQVYANITGQLPSTILAADGSVDPAAQRLAQQLLDHDNTPSSLVYRLYTWDSAQQGGYPSQSYVPGAYPLTPGAGYGQ